MKLMMLMMMRRERGTGIKSSEAEHRVLVVACEQSRCLVVRCFVRHKHVFGVVERDAVLHHRLAHQIAHDLSLA
jgi:hypothetical protein